VYWKGGDAASVASILGVGTLQEPIMEKGGSISKERKETLIA